MDRLMGKVGLPGKSFVPMLSAHACAIPALMSTRVIEGRRDRLVTILVLPLLTCSARLPVYAMVAALLFAGRPLLGGVMFAAAYALGIAAALAMAWLFKRSVLPRREAPAAAGASELQAAEPTQRRAGRRRPRPRVPAQGG